MSTITSQEPMRRLRTEAAAEYLIQVHGIKAAPKTLRNLRSAGTGPRWQYFGSVPYTTPSDLDHWVEQRLSDFPTNRRKNAA